MLDISVIGGQSGPVLILDGEIDVTTAGVVAGTVERYLRSRPPQMTVDLRSVTFCDGAGGRVLQYAHERASAAGACFRLTGLTGPVWRVLTLMRATCLLPAAGTGGAGDG